MTVPASFAKRLEELGNAINFRHARTIVVAVPTELTPIEGSVENDAIVAPEIREEVNAILETIGADDRDTVIEVAQYTIGGPPKLLSVT